MSVAKKTSYNEFFSQLRRLLLNFKEGMTAWPEGYNELYGHNLEQSQNKCLKKMNNTCSIVKLLKEKDGKSNFNFRNTLANQIFVKKLKSFI